MMEALGARLFAMWETTPYNGHWPEATIIWEIDAFADYARIGKAQAPGGSHADAAAAGGRSCPRSERPVRAASCTPGSSTGHSLR